MLTVYGHIKEQYESNNHKKAIVGGNYFIGIDFEVEIDAVSIDQDAMPISESDNLIINAINKKYRTDFIQSNTFINPLKIKKRTNECN